MSCGNLRMMMLMEAIRIREEGRYYSTRRKGFKGSMNGVRRDEDTKVEVRRTKEKYEEE